MTKEPVLREPCRHSCDPYLQRQHWLDRSREAHLDRTAHLPGIDASGQNGTEAADVEEFGTHEIAQPRRLVIRFRVELFLLRDRCILWPHRDIRFAVLFVDRAGRRAGASVSHGSDQI
jgi:hypothetical protein